jgi:hypothetical protein
VSRSPLRPGLLEARLQRLAAAALFQHFEGDRAQVTSHLEKSE